MTAVCSNYRDAALNLAIEETLFTTLPPDHPGYFMLWQNEPSVIIGRHQCAEEEINADFLRAHKIAVFRRITGGGAVYHDLGNLNYSFIVNDSSLHQYSLKKYLEPVCSALASLGVAAELSGRNDIEAAGRKISGCAQLRHGHKLLLHGTLLVQVNLDMLCGALNPSRLKITSRGVPSVRARVGNLAEYWTPDKTLADLKAALLAQCAPAGARSLPEAMLRQASELAQKKYRTREWNFQRQPPFNVEKRERFPWGEIILRLLVNSGRIAACDIRGDFFSNTGTAAMSRKLCGTEFNARALETVLADMNLEDIFAGSEQAAMIRFFKNVPPGLPGSE